MNFSEINQDKLFFIIGPMRSGTSLFQLIMNTFNGFCNDKEATTSTKGFNCYRHIIKNGDFSYLENFIKTNWTREFFVEKTPNSIFCLPQLFDRYQNANYLFLERNPLKMALSRMNFMQSSKFPEKIQKERLNEANVSKKAFKFTSYEQLIANNTLAAVKNQIKHKSKFKNQITIRYENFVKNLEENILSIQSKFKISSNIELAKQVLSKPSYSSKKNTYEIKELKDEFSIKSIQEACKLWNYEYDNTTIKNYTL